MRAGVEELHVGTNVMGRPVVVAADKWESERAAGTMHEVGRIYCRDPAGSMSSTYMTAKQFVNLSTVQVTYLVSSTNKSRGFVSR